MNNRTNLSFPNFKHFKYNFSVTPPMWKYSRILHTMQDSILFYSSRRLQLNSHKNSFINVSTATLLQHWGTSTLNTVTAHTLRPGGRKRQSLAFFQKKETFSDAEQMIHWWQMEIRIKHLRNVKEDRDTVVGYESVNSRNYSSPFTAQNQLILREKRIIFDILKLL